MAHNPQKKIKLYGFIVALSILALLLILTVVSFPTRDVGILFQKAEDQLENRNQLTIPTKKQLDVPYLSQREKYPTGCESVSATMLLKYWDFAISAERFIDVYLPKGIAPYQGSDGKYIADNPWECFLGNPYSEQGWGCYAPVILKALQTVLDGTTLEAKDLSGTSLNEVCENYIAKDIPVILWATIDMEPARRSKSWKHLHDEKYTTWISPMHVLVLTGYDQEYYYFNDPWQEKNTKYPKEQVRKAYLALGRQAVAIVPKV